MPAEQEAIPKRQVKFLSLYVLGKDFYAFHKDADTKEFVKWLANFRKPWCEENTGVHRKLGDYSFENLVEAIYTKQLGNIDYPLLTQYLFKWYLQDHGIFRFSGFERLFVSLRHSHLLQVLYGVSDNEVVIFDASKRIADILVQPEDYKNIQLIGTNSNYNQERQIADHLIPNVDKSLSHFKLITDDASKNALYQEKLSANGITNVMQLEFKNVTTVPNDEVAKARYERYDVFNGFSDKAEKTFRDLLDKNPKAKRFDDAYLLEVWSDKTHPKNDHIYVNVAFGSRILTVSHHNRGFSSTCEQGSRLCFYRMEDGFVSVSLYPAKIDERRPVEDAIMLYDSINPERLNDEAFIKDCWADLVSYMECTAIDGSPSGWQKWRVGYLRFIKHLIVEGVYLPTKRLIAMEKIGEYILTIGCSGFLIAMIQYCSSSSTSPELLNEQLIQHVDSTQAKIKESVDKVVEVMRGDSIADTPQL